MKKALVVSLILSFVLFLIMGINYIGNEKMIKNYQNEIYKVNSLDVLGFFQPYIAPYNRGNIDYQLGNYDQAIEEYKKALEKHPPQKKECMIRINLALAMVAGIDFENLTADQVDETIQILEEAIDVLVEKNCANRDHQSGHNVDAQQLEIELQQIIDALKNASSSGDGEDNRQQPDDGSKEQNDPAQGGETKEKSELQQKFEEQQKDVQKERNDMYEINELYKMDFDYSDAPVW